VTVIGLDDTDSRERGMCTTYAAARVAAALGERGASVERLLLVRLNPAVRHKTRGNAALAIHTDADPETAFAVARAEVAASAETDDPRTNPGLVVAAHDPDDAPEAVVDFARDALCDLLSIDDARSLAAAVGYRVEGWKNGRGRIGALAAVGAWPAFDDWTYELITYRPRERWGTERDVDYESVFAAADRGYPTVWDTVDRGEGQAVCVPHTPGPILHGIRGDDPEAVQSVAAAIDAEPAERTALFVTNQGTDAHLSDAALADVSDGHAYRVDGVVASTPETREGGHVFFDLRAPGEPTDARDSVVRQCAAFEPTKRFRDRVRALRPGDRLTVCGEVARGTLKLEKFAVRSLCRTALVTPTCPDCDRRMESAGADQGYRCRDCGTSAPGKVERPVARDLEGGWYEVPPCARRHVARPLVRGGFDAPTHPER